MRGTGRSGRAAGAAAAIFAAGLLLSPALPPPKAVASEPALNIESDGKTKPDHIGYLARECLDEQGAEGNADVDGPKLEQCLLNSELFSEVSVDAAEDLTIAVKDRWTLIPFPFVRSQEDSTNIGAFVVDSNFLGRGQLIVLGATFGSLGDTWFAMLRDPSVASTEWTSQIMYIQDFGDIYRYEGERKVDGFNESERSFIAAPGYRFTADIEGRFLLGYTSRRFDSAGDFDTLPEDHHFWTAGLGVELDASDYRFYYSAGHRVKLDVRHQFARSGGDAAALTAKAEWNWQRLLDKRSVIKLNVEGMTVGGGEIADTFQTGGKKSLRGVQEKGLWARHLGGAVLDWHFPLREGRLGTWAAGPFLSGALYSPAAEDGGDWKSTFSFGVGLFLYLKKVAFPGVGIVAGRNRDFSGSFVTFQIGFGY